MGVDREVTLKGTLICTTQEQAERVVQGIDAHIALTRAEPGCLSFEVDASDDPMVWTVSERFTGPEAFEAHQTRTAASKWAELTKGIARAYKITGMP